MSAPRQIKTERLVLHAPLEIDRIAYHRFCFSKRRIALAGKMTREEADGRFDGYLRDWIDHGYGRYVLHLDGVAIGMVGLTRHPAETELVWVIWHHAEAGKGYAFEAAEAVRNVAQEALGLGPLVSYIAPSNTRSIALAKRLGAVLEEGPLPEGVLPGHLIYRHPVKADT